MFACRACLKNDIILMLSKFLIGIENAKILRRASSAVFALFLLKALELLLVISNKFFICRLKIPPRPRAQRSEAEDNTVRQSCSVW